MIDELIRKVDFNIEDGLLAARLERLFFMCVRKGEDVRDAMRYLVDRDHYIAAMVYIRLSGKISRDISHDLEEIVNDFSSDSIMKQSHFRAAIILENTAWVRRMLSAVDSLDDYLIRLESADDLQKSLVYLIKVAATKVKTSLRTYSSIARLYRINDVYYARQCKDTVTDLLEKANKVYFGRLVRYFVTIFEDVPFESFCGIEIYRLVEQLRDGPNIRSMILLSKILDMTDIPKEEKLELLRGFLPREAGNDLKSMAFYLLFAYAVVIDPEISEGEMRSFYLPDIEIDLNDRSELVQQAFMRPFIRLLEADSPCLSVFLELSKPVNPYRLESGYQNIRLFHMMYISKYDAQRYRREAWDSFVQKRSDKTNVTIVYLNSPIKCWINPKNFLKLFFPVKRLIKNPGEMIKAQRFSAEIIRINTDKNILFVRLLDSDIDNDTFSLSIIYGMPYLELGDRIEFSIESYDGVKESIIPHDVSVLNDGSLTEEEVKKLIYDICDKSSVSLQGAKVYLKEKKVMLMPKYMTMLDQIYDRIEYITGFDVHTVTDLYLNTFMPSRGNPPMDKESTGSIIAQYYSNRNDENTPELFNIHDDILFLQFRNFAAAYRAVNYNSGNLRMVADRTGYLVKVIPLEIN